MAHQTFQLFMYKLILMYCVSEKTKSNTKKLFPVTYFGGQPCCTVVHSHNLICMRLVEEVITQNVCVALTMPLSQDLNLYDKHSSVYTVTKP